MLRENLWILYGLAFPWEKGRLKTTDIVLGKSVVNSFTPENYPSNCPSLCHLKGQLLDSYAAKGYCCYSNHSTDQHGFHYGSIPMIYYHRHPMACPSQLQIPEKSHAPRGGEMTQETPLISAQKRFLAL
uniref:Uncharacterized protein n=1 Tax=Salix viminalis TaxID=40686 RepID=A0A6N2M6I7_SALVM